MPTKHHIRVISEEGNTELDAQGDEATPPAGSTSGGVSTEGTKACSTDDVVTTAAAATEAAVDSSKKKKRGRPPGSKSKENCAKKKKISSGKPFIDLTGVPPQPLLLKNALSRTTDYKDNSRRRPVNEGSSKYTGVYFDKACAKWKAQIMVNARVRSIGHYEKEEEAASDYARAAFKYKATKGGSDIYAGLDLSSIPEQPLIPSHTASGYKGVKKLRDRWQARICVEKGGSVKTLGTFDDAEEAAGIYARAVFYLEQRQVGGVAGVARKSSKGFEDQGARVGSVATYDNHIDDGVSNGDPVGVSAADVDVIEV